jgi:hypothetical protein
METTVMAGEDVKTVFENKVKELENTLKDTIARFEKKAAVLEQGNQYLQEKLKAGLFRQFARHAEKFTGEGQLPLFDAGEDAAPQAPQRADEGETVQSSCRARRGGKAIDENIPRREEIIDLPEAEKHWSALGKMSPSGW